MTKYNSSEATSKRRSNESGSVLLEFSVLMPLFVFMFTGIVNFGLALRESRLLSQAAYVGSSAGAALPEGTNNPALVTDTINRAIDTFLANSTLDPDQYSVRIAQIVIANSDGTNSYGATVTVGRKTTGEVSYFTQMTAPTSCQASTSLLSGENQLAPQAETIVDC